MEPRVEGAPVRIFRSIENPDERLNVFEAGLTWIGFAGLDPHDILRGCIDARFDAAESVLDGRLRDQLMRRRGVEVGAGLFFQDRMIAFQGQEKIGLVRDDFGGDLDLAPSAGHSTKLRLTEPLDGSAHGVDGHEGAFELPCLCKMIEKLGNGSDLVGFFGHVSCASVRRAFVA